jgi:hypothetical protein
LLRNFYRAPNLLVLVAQKDAAVMENVANYVAVSRCRAVVKGIFSNAAVPQPKEIILILWRTNS